MSLRATDEKEPIKEWLRSNWTDPVRCGHGPLCVVLAWQWLGLTSRASMYVRQMTNQKLTVKRLTPNHSLRSVIQQWREDHPNYSE